ncbi:hypothetical protein O2N63_13360 [Aliiroseovarius sp. KMU-50]|uniref:Apea-like HEPN domain-containing protein n=1 Tax=Aliiroseovarius salicola TaxID=3009082 RepID=A0ABT4W3H2_9RHOB|nr:hypothetical protein [Aliiroseovarius sp. KMU-50]MDA5095071.1 hypothetical protein [Aliiroseovarius sp. KMU-50]
MNEINSRDHVKHDPFLTWELYAIIGRIMFLWSSTEKDLRREISRLHPAVEKKKTHQISRLIKLWKALLLESAVEGPAHEEIIEAAYLRLNKALDVRNRLTHGLTGLEGSQEGCKETAYLYTELNGKKQKISLTELEETADSLNKVYSYMTTVYFWTQKPIQPYEEIAYNEFRNRIVIR